MTENEFMYDKTLFDKHTKYNSTCVRKKSNFSVPGKLNLIDSKSGEIEYFKKNIEKISPKLTTLFKTIEKLDEDDMRTHGKLFKHFIFTDIRSSLYGAKIIGSGFIEKGYNLGYTAQKKKTFDSTLISKKQYGKIQLFTETELKQKTPNKNFYILSSSGLFDQPIGRELKKNILKNFNERPGNVYGQNVRFIIMDSGYKEGIDLFDIKYIHIFEPQTTMADLKQVIGRGTRLCGQKGLEFHPQHGWELNVYVYDLNIEKNIQPLFLNSKSAFDLYLKSLNYDISLFNFQSSLEEVVIDGAVDYELNKNINKHVPEEVTEEVTVDVTTGGANTPVLDEKDNEDMSNGKKMDFKETQEYIRRLFKRFTWEKIKIQNDCVEKGAKGGKHDGGNKQTGGLNPVLIDYTQTQDFVRHFFTPQLYNRGILLWHSVGTGKTCTAIATATSTFEKQGYTILWVTRTTLINDIWKNMFSLVCNESIRKKIQTENITIPDDLNKQVKLLSKSWKIHPISYKQFTNLVSKKNQFYKILEKENGAEDPLKKTLIIIDEAHKLYGESDLLANEKPNMDELHASLMNSYAVSGKNSVKLMLMTATPITKDPMELIKLLNLCKPIEEQLPVDFYAFKEKFLNQEGVFTEANKMRFINDIAGYVSYLDRSNDIRQFAQPKLHYVNTNLVTDEDIIINDKRAVREINKVLKKESKKNNQLFEKEYKSGRLQLKRIKTEFKESLDKVFEPRLEAFSSKKMRSRANKTIKYGVKRNYKEMLDTYKERLTDYKEKLKQKVIFGKEKDEEKDEEEENKDPNFKKNVFYNLRYKCGKSFQNPKLNDYVNSNPEIAKMMDTMKALEANIEAQEKRRDEKIKILRSLMKQSKNEQDENKFKLNKKLLENTKNSSKIDLKNLANELNSVKQETKKNIKILKKDLKSVINNNIKTRKRELKEDLKRKKKELIQEKEDYNEYTTELLERTKDNILKDVDTELDLLLKKEQDDIQKKEEKIQNKLENNEEKKVKKEKKNEEKTRKKLEKEREKQEVKTNKTRKNLEKQIEKQKEKQIEKQKEKQIEKEQKQIEAEKKKQEKQIEKQIEAEKKKQEKQIEAEKKKQEKQIEKQIEADKKKQEKQIEKQIEADKKKQEKQIEAERKKQEKQREKEEKRGL